MLGLIAFEVVASEVIASEGPSNFRNTVFKKMLESRPEDALVKLEKTVETVQTVKTVETVETVETVWTVNLKKYELLNY